MALRRFMKKPAKSEDATESVESLSEEQVEPSVAPDRSQLYNRLAMALLIMAPLLLLCYLLIFLVPGLPINPFRPYEEALATFAPTPTLQPTYTPTWTSTSTNTPTNTPRPTFTRTPTVTPSPTIDFRASITGTARASFLPTRTPSPTPSPTVGPTQSPHKYTADVQYQYAQLYGVNWSGIAGIVIGLDLKYQPGIGVKVWGDEPLGPNGRLLPSGIEPRYGPSGWEFTLGDKPVSGTYYVQLLGPNGEPLSEAVEIDLKGDPRANLAYVIFRQNH